MEDERSAHSENATEKTGFEDDVVSRRSLAGARRIGCGWAVAGPVVPREHEGGEIDFMHELEEPFQCRRPRIERSRPGLYVRNVFEATRQGLEQLLLFS